MEETTTNPDNFQGRVLVDNAAGERYNFIVTEGSNIFSKSPLTINGAPITAQDVALIDQFHTAVSPTNPAHPWRLQPEFIVHTQAEAEAYRNAGKIIDTSFYANWDVPGGPLEHIRLATNAGRIITEFLQNHLKDSEQRGTLESLNPYLISAAAAFHDDGRLVTHLPTNGPLGKRMLQRMSIREDIIDAIPDEEIYFQVPLNESMEEAVMRINPKKLIIGLADNFGKRYPGTNRLFQPSDISSEHMQGWADSYAQRPQSGRPSQRAFVAGLPLHLRNDDRILPGFDHWIRTVSNTNLQAVINELDQQLTPMLPTIS